MKNWRSPNIDLWLVSILVGVISTLVTQSAWAETKLNNPVERGHKEQKIDRLSEFNQPATTVTDWLTQRETAPVQITGVRIETTEKGLQLILETIEGELAAPRTETVSNALIVEIPNTVLALPQEEGFEQFEPAEGIAFVSVTGLPDNRVQVSITGTDALPEVQISTEAGNLVLSVVPSLERVDGADEAINDETIEVVVTGEQETGYYVPNTSVGTRTDTPLRDIPQSIQVVPQQVLEEQQVNTLNEAIKNVPGATQTAPNYIPGFAGFTIRGFSIGDFDQNVTRNGLSYGIPAGASAIFANIKQVEILRGPASVLFGAGAPGGIINIVTKQPLRDPFYELEATIGSYNLYGGEIDLTGPLNDPKTVLYRLNASYNYTETFIDFSEIEIPAVASALNFEIGSNTDLNVDLEYSQINQSYPSGLPAIGTVLPNPNGEIPRNRNLSEADSEYSPEVFRVGYDLEHRFSENWRLRNAFYYSYLHQKIRGIRPSSLEPDLRTVQRQGGDRDARERIFDLFTNMVGQFSTGAIEHQLLFGVDLRRSNFSNISPGFFRGTPLDIFNPVYSSQTFEETFPPSDDKVLTDSIGIYLQDQVTLADNFKLLLGGRFDAFKQTQEDFIDDTEESQSGNAFSPRVGIVYQPIEPISLYASYTRSFAPTIGTAADNESFEPGRGTQYEIGVKADINDRLSTTLALYDLTRTNVTTTDPDNPDFQIQTGEQNSQGIELFISGEILPGWNVIAGYAYTNAKITEDNTFPVGNRLRNVAENTFNLWTSYELPAGSLQGLGLGLGFFYVGDRPGDLDNSFTLPSYFRTDAAIFYTRGQFRAAVNFRNLFDVDYFESAYGDLSVYRGEPFTVQGTVSWRF
jgi:iron complex outermembrane receptor protein